MGRTQSSVCNRPSAQQSPPLRRCSANLGRTWLWARCASGHGRGLLVDCFAERKSPEADTWIRREFRCFRSKWPTIRHLSPKYLQQSLDFHKCSFSPPGVLVDESDGVSHSPTFG